MSRICGRLHRGRPVPWPSRLGTGAGLLSPVCGSVPVQALLLCLVSSTGHSADVMLPVDTRHVSVGGQIGKRIELTIRNNVLALDADRDFLAPFRKKESAGGYIGLGKLIETAARLAVHTGDEQVLALEKHLVSEALACQDRDGYLGMLRPDARMWGLWDLSEMAYLIQGLVMDHRLFGRRNSLEGARRLADYILRRWSAEPDRIPGGGHLTMHMAVVGLEPALLSIHEATGDPRHLDFCKEFRGLSQWNPRIVLGRWGHIEGHVYAYLCECLAQLRLYRIRQEPRLLEPARRAVDFLTTRDGLVITGACGDHECWHDSQEGTINLGETCATAYWVRLLDELLRMEGDPRYGDLMERVLYNTLFAAQSPDGRRIRYYTPLDGPRAYHESDTYCCPSNYRRIVAELPGMVYYRFGNGIAVNLYTSSTVRVGLDKGASLVMRQETGYPDSGEVLLEVDPSAPCRIPIRLRIPRWCTGAKASVNGKPVGVMMEEGGWLVLDREWASGDTIRLEIPISPRLVKGRKAQAGRVAVMRGPVVFCLNRALNESLEGTDPRLLVLDPSSLRESRRDGDFPYGPLSIKLRAWRPGAWYPAARADLSLVLTPFPDPAGVAVYFKVPNPEDPSFVEDELIGPGAPYTSSGTTKGFR